MSRVASAVTVVTTDGDAGRFGVTVSSMTSVSADTSRPSLLVSIHQDTAGGTRCFQLLAKLLSESDEHLDLIEVFYQVLSLGFVGRYAGLPDGHRQIDAIRQRLLALVSAKRGELPRELSPHWRGVSARYKPLRTAAALWTVLSALVLLLGLGYVFFTFSLNRASDGTFERLAGLGPAEQPSLLARPRPPEPKQEEPAPQPPPQPPQPKEPSRLENLMAFLQPEVDRKLVSLFDADGRLLVRINNTGMFPVASAEVSPKFRDLLQRIGGALAADNFRALVVGYTDNDPIRTLEFPSNWRLSEARAKAVGDILMQFTGPEAIVTKGEADRNPIAGNDTPEGREANRRTEILVLTDPKDRLDQIGLMPMQAVPPADPASRRETTP